MAKQITSAVLWEGPSQLDGAPIVAIVTGLGRASKNSKTGNMAQVWILRSDVNPVEAVRKGLDGAICGHGEHRCRHAGSGLKGFEDRTCYVTVVQAPNAVFKAYAAGRYPRLTPQEIGRLLAGRSVRLGAYGDPAAVPAGVLRAAVGLAKRHTGYTHQWRIAPEYRGLIMASVDTAAEYREARAAGWRTFRVRAPWEALQAHEIVCPASHERPLTTCEACGLCNGATAADKRATIAIMAHGAGTAAFVSLQSLRRAS